jgi:hypothetical protein
MRRRNTNAYLRCLRGRPDAELQAVAASMAQAAETFGNPHAHSGTEIRRLDRNLFEWRVSLELRLVFTRDEDALVFVFAGNHDDVQDFLRNR